MKLRKPTIKVPALEDLHVHPRVRRFSNRALAFNAAFVLAVVLIVVSMLGFLMWIMGRLPQEFVDPATIDAVPHVISRDAIRGAVIVGLCLGLGLGMVFWSLPDYVIEVLVRLKGRRQASTTLNPRER